uniref:Uncharacterized protein n=1 Tax=Musca domestica TaxID=7370 RepID=A0A1I8MT43_MUSDO
MTVLKINDKQFKGPAQDMADQCDLPKTPKHNKAVDNTPIAGAVKSKTMLDENKKVGKADKEGSSKECFEHLYNKKAPLCPVTILEFRQYTNVDDVVRDFCQQTYGKNSKVSFEEQMKRFFLYFYTHPKLRTEPPLNRVQLKGNCPAEMQLKLLDEIKRKKKTKSIKTVTGSEQHDSLPLNEKHGQEDQEKVPGGKENVIENRKMLSGNVANCKHQNEQQQQYPKSDPKKTSELHMPTTLVPTIDGSMVRSNPIPDKEIVHQQCREVEELGDGEERHTIELKSYSGMQTNIQKTTIESTTKTSVAIVPPNTLNINVKPQSVLKGCDVRVNENPIKRPAQNVFKQNDEPTTSKRPKVDAFTGQQEVNGENRNTHISKGGKESCGKILFENLYNKKVKLCPVTISEFRKYTNVDAVVKDFCQQTYGKDSKVSFDEQLKRFYLYFYTHPKLRLEAPLVSVKLVDDCPPEVKAKLLDEIKRKKKTKTTTNDDGYLLRNSSNENLMPHNGSKPETQIISKNNSDSMEINNNQTASNEQNSVGENQNFVFRNISNSSSKKQTSLNKQELLETWLKTTTEMLMQPTLDSLQIDSEQTNNEVSRAGLQQGCAFENPQNEMRNTKDTQFKKNMCHNVAEAELISHDRGNQNSSGHNEERLPNNRVQILDNVVLHDLYPVDQLNQTNVSEIVSTPINNRCLGCNISLQEFVGGTNIMQILESRYETVNMETVYQVYVQFLKDVDYDDLWKSSMVMTFRLVELYKTCTKLCDRCKLLQDSTLEIQPAMTDRLPQNEAGFQATNHTVEMQDLNRILLRVLGHKSQTVIQPVHEENTAQQVVEETTANNIQFRHGTEENHEPLVPGNEPNITKAHQSEISPQISSIGTEATVVPNKKPTRTANKPGDSDPKFTLEQILTKIQSSERWYQKFKTNLLENLKNCQSGAINAVMPVSLEQFKKCSHYETPIRDNLKSYCGNNSELLNKLENDLDIYQEVLCCYYKSYFTIPNFRHKYPLKLKLCPASIRKKMLSFQVKGTSSSYDLNNENISPPSSPMKVVINDVVMDKCNMANTEFESANESQPTHIILSNTCLEDHNGKSKPVVNWKTSPQKTLKKPQLQYHVTADGRYAEPIAILLEETTPSINQQETVAKDRKEYGIISALSVATQTSNSHSSVPCAVNTAAIPVTKAAKKVHFKTPTSNEPENVTGLKEYPKASPHPPTKLEEEVFSATTSSNTMETVTELAKSANSPKTKLAAPVKQKEVMQKMKQNVEIISNIANYEKTVEKTSKPDKHCGPAMSCNSNENEADIEKLIEKATTSTATLNSKRTEKPATLLPGHQNADEKVAPSESEIATCSNPQKPVEETNPSNTAIIKTVDKFINKNQDAVMQSKKSRHPAKSTTTKKALQNKRAFIFLPSKYRSIFNRKSATTKNEGSTTKSLPSTTTVYENLSQQQQQELTQANTTIYSDSSLDEEPANESQCKLMAILKERETFSLRYMSRVSCGLKQRIIGLINNLSFDEFRGTIKLYQAPEICEDDTSANKLYNYVLKEKCLWPKGLYIPVKDLCFLLKKNSFTIPDTDTTLLKYISPRFLHWIDLVYSTTFLANVHLYYTHVNNQCLNATDNEEVEKACQAYYNECWQKNSWCLSVPTLSFDLLGIVPVQQAVQKEKRNSNDLQATKSNTFEQENNNSSKDKQVETKRDFIRNSSPLSIRWNSSTDTVLSCVAADVEQNANNNPLLDQANFVDIPQSTQLARADTTMFSELPIEELSSVGASQKSDPLKDAMNDDDDGESSDDCCVIPPKNIKTEPIENHALRNLLFTLSDDEDTIHCSKISEEIVDLDCSTGGYAIPDDANLPPSQIDFDASNDGSGVTANYPNKLQSSAECLSSGDSSSILNPGQRLPSSTGSLNEAQTEVVHLPSILEHDVNMMGGSESDNGIQLTPYAGVKIKSKASNHTEDDNVEVSHSLMQNAQRLPSSLEETALENNEKIALQPVPQSSMVRANQEPMVRIPITVVTAKKTTQKKITGRSDLVPQLTHNIRPLPIVLGRNTNLQGPQRRASLTCILEPNEFEPGPTSTQINPTLHPPVIATVQDDHNFALPSSSGSSAAASGTSLRVSQELSTDKTLFNNTSLLRALDNAGRAQECLATDLETQPASTAKQPLIKVTTPIPSPSPPPAMVQRNLLFYTLIEFHYFENLQPSHVLQYELPTMHYGYPYLLATISSGELKTKLLFSSFFTLISSQWPLALRNDFQAILKDLKEYHYYRFRRSSQHDLRASILNALLDNASPFCLAQLSYAELNSEFSHCSALEKSFYRREPFRPLVEAVPKNILQNCKAFKANLRISEGVKSPKS